MITLPEAHRFLVERPVYTNDLTPPRQRRRGVTITRGSDGSYVLHGEVTAEFVAVWNPIFDTLAAPIPTQPTDGVPEHLVADPRTPAQRRHDAMVEVAQRVLRSGTLPDCGGVPATVVVAITEQQLRERVGTVHTDHDEPLSVQDALRLAAEAEIIPVVLDNAGGVLAYGRTRRIASAGQRRALFQRDGGCSFPGCTRPASWCQANHVIRWEDGGPTDIDNMHLVCPWHHREFERRGWAVRIRDGNVEWLPPEWLDPERKPVRNTAHHLPDYDFTTAS